jgi:hypothetical protein
VVNHWSAAGDLVIEQKTLFRQVGWLGQSGQFYALTEIPTEPGGFAPVYQQIATWKDGEGWDE